MGICLIVKSGGGIDTSSATATADKILSGYTIYSNDNKVTGIMTNVGAQTESGKGVSSSTTIKAGWHDGAGKITASELKSQMDATTAAVGDVLTGYTYWTNGSNSKYTGTMTSRGTKAWTIAVNGSQTIESGWHSGSGTVKQSSTVATSSEWKLMTPTTSNQTLCNASTYYSQNRWCAGADTLTAANIKKDITIFGVKGTYEGSIIWLIKNGDVASGLNVRWLKKSIPNDDANNWWREDITDNSGIAKRIVNNKTWRMLCHTWYSSNTTWNQLLAFRDIVGTKVKVSGSSRSDYTIQGVVGGDFWYDTGCTRLDANAGFQIWFGLNSNNADTTNKCWQTITPLRSSIIWAGTEFSFRQTGINTRGSGTMWCTYGDFAFYTHPSNDQYTTYLFAYNLWIDTSTIPS